MAASKSPKKKPKKDAIAIHVPFPVEHLSHPDLGLPVLVPVPESDTPVEPSPFKVECKVASVSTHFWSGIVFVALEATDGQNLLDFLRQGQEVSVHYKP